MSKRKMLYIVFLFIVFITSFRLIWFKNSFYIHQPFVQSGNLNLVNFKFDEKNIVILNGEWSFYPNVLLNPDRMKNKSIEKKDGLRFLVNGLEKFRKLMVIKNVVRMHYQSM